ncbi:N-6 DNA methylase [Natronolimnohabitans innermongolicus]|uniref:N-6 DNA methylase n=1 Tax=Natronolimnohabitans innermongolicus TaxID=253107 RepID=UPI0019D3DC5B|nr:N-6 DNA methylase [Natronolimnohabitans innermongolicus]
MSSQIKPEIREMVTDSLNEISVKTGDSSYQVFSDFLDLTISSFSGDERQYSAQIERYRTDGHDMATVKNLLQLHAKALSGLVVGLEKTNEDVLGAVYEHYSTTSDNFAQHFTPGSVSGTMAEIAFPDEDKIRNASPDYPLLIGDLSGCGSGSLLLESAYRLQNIRRDCPAIYVGWDIDPDCTKMCVINFVLNGLPGYVFQGDTLQVQVNRCWKIEPTNLSREKMPVAEIPNGDTAYIEVKSSTHVDDGTVKFPDR